MNAAQMAAKVDQHVEKMMVAAIDSDVAEIESLNDAGYEYARGSNRRKQNLHDGYEAAMARVAANKAAEAERVAAEAQVETIDANSIATFPAGKREHVVFVPQPAAKMSDGERDEYASGHVIWPAGWRLVGTIATRARAGDRSPHGWNIRLRFQPVAEA